VIPTLLALITSGELGHHLTATSQRLAIGYLAGAILCLLLRRAMGGRDWLWSGFSLFVVLLGLCPILPILVILVGHFRLVDPISPVIVAMAVFFTVLWTARIDGTRPNATDRFRNTFSQQDHRWWPPNAWRLPALSGGFMGLRLSAWLALFVLLPLEMLGSKDGLGYVLWQSWLTFSVETLFAVMIVVGLLVYAVWWLFDVVS
jgi:NitT/TauT family transport system permease protein